MDRYYTAVRGTEASAARRARWRLYGWPAVAFVLSFLLWMQGKFL